MTFFSTAVRIFFRIHVNQITEARLNTSYYWIDDNIRTK